MKVETVTLEEALEKGVKGKSGKLYAYNSELSAARHSKMQEWLIEVEYSKSSTQFHDFLNNIIEDLNESKIVQASWKIKEIQEAIEQSVSQTIPVAKIFCLFFDTEDENSVEFSETKIMAKVKDLDHYSYYSFFGLVLSLLSLSKERFSKIAELNNQDTLQQSLSQALKNAKENTEQVVSEPSK